MAEKANKALCALCATIDALGIKSIEVKLRLFNMLVMPIGNYGSQVWGVEYLRIDSEAHIFSDPLQKLVFLFLKTINGAYVNTSRWVLLNEFGFVPTQVTWCCWCARWWNKCLIGTNGRLLQKVLQHDIELFQKGNDKCWSAKFLVCMGRLNQLGENSISFLRRGPSSNLFDLRFSESEIRQAFTLHYKTLQNVSEVDPRVAPSRGLALTKHTQWFASDKFLHHKFSAPHKQLKDLLKFRLGSVPLNCYKHNIQPREARVCTFCRSHTLEDEKHMVFECEAYGGLRADARWASLFTCVETGLDMKTFMAQRAGLRFLS
jgi:hypothetical protein